MKKRRHRVSQTEAQRTLSKIIAAVQYGGDEFIVERRGEAVCKISPVDRGPVPGAELVRLFERHRGKVDPGFRKDVGWAIAHQPPMRMPEWPR
jgi:antitoxin (DNA-binding transcriptional repressor) of toxin-antitoxin stability system